MAKLSNKQKMFVKEYIIDFNATRSAIAAGYSKKTARQMGYELLTKLYIQEAVQKELKPIIKQHGMSAQEVLDGIEYIYTNNKEDDPKAAISALNLAGKYHKLFTEKIEHSGKIEMPTVVIEK